ncbi:MAG: hypothetical protein HYT27_02250 [Parcubacteria group bacterium]|nr:hypothetical protein [Parcubacteria group bacterium]
MPDIHLLADLAAEKIRGGYRMPHALNSALKDAGVPEDEREKLRHEVAVELNKRSQLRRKKNRQNASLNAKRGARKIVDRETALRAKKALEKIMEEERRREAHRMAYERRDHLLPDLY